MSNITNKKTQALEACEKVINGIEDGVLTISSALLLCKKIARLVNDQEGLEWLNYEHSGYPRNSSGNIPHDVWQVAANHGKIAVHSMTFEYSVTLGTPFVSKPNNTLK